MYIMKMKLLLILLITSLSFAKVYDVLVVGGGPAGLTSGMYASRMGLATFVAEGEMPGGQLITTHIVENFPGFADGIEGPDLVRNMRRQAERYGAKIASLNAAGIDLSKRPYAVTLSSGEIVEGRVLIVATGSSPKLLGLESEAALFGNGVSTCAVCDAPLYKGQDVVVVGGGDSAFEEALLLAKFAKKVTLLHRSDMFRASAILQERVKGTKNIEVFEHMVVKEILDPKKGDVEGVIAVDVRDQKETKIACDGVFIAIGQIPNTAWLAGSVECDSSGMITSVPEGVFPSGDVIDTRYRQAITAAASGCKAALDAYQYIQSQGDTK
jgi:thioredoxin reductase (NADPH)